MELFKSNLIDFNINYALITNNFEQIQSEINKMNQSIQSLKLQNQSLQQKVQVLSLGHAKLIQLNETPINSKIHNSQEEIIDSLPSIAIIKVDQSEKSKGNLEKENSIKNIMKKQKSKLNLKKTKSKPLNQSNYGIKTEANSNQLQLQNNKQINKRKSIGDEQIINKENYEVLFRDLYERIQQLQQTNQSRQLSIETIRKQAEQMKSFVISKFNIKKKGSTHTEKQNKKSTQNEQKKQGEQQQQEKQPERNNQFNIFEHNSDEIENLSDITDFLRNKVRILSVQQCKILNKIQYMERKERIIQATQEIMKKDIEIIEYQKKQAKLKEDQRHSGQMSKKHPQSRILNQTMQTNRAYYEDKLIQLFQEMEKIKKQYLQISEKLNNEEGDEESIIQRQKVLAIRIQQISGTTTDEKLRKQFHHYKKQFKKFKQEFQRLIYGVNTGSNQSKTYIIKPNQSKQDWKELTTKLHKFKTELHSNIRQLQGKIANSNEACEIINELEIGIGQCKIILKRKVDYNDFEKTIKRLENRLNNFIRQIYEREGISNEQDAMIAKQPWYCLSCDTQLKNFAGKTSKPPQPEKMMGKKVNPQSHMVRRSQGRFPSLPSTHQN